MQVKAILALSFLSAAQVSFAQPPACLLAAINTQPNVADMKTICGQKSSDVQKTIQNVCSGDDKSTALTSFADTCKQNGVTVSSVVVTSSSPTSPSASSGTKDPQISFGASILSVASDKPVIVSSAYFNSSCSCTLTTSFTGNSKPDAAAATGSSATGSSATGSTASGSTAKVAGAATSSSVAASGTASSGTATGSAKAATAGKSGAVGQAVGSFAGLVVAAAGVVYLL